MPGIRDLIDLQPEGGSVKEYQVRQVRKYLQRHGR
jgi:hypothetical protein